MLRCDDVVAEMEALGSGAGKTAMDVSSSPTAASSERLDCSEAEGVVRVVLPPCAFFSLRFHF